MIVAQVIEVVGGVKLITHGRGRRSAISRSNNKNRIATRKNREEKGSRAVPWGSNPHSYGESFSAFEYGIGNQKATVISAVTMASDSMIMNRIVITLS